LKRINALKDTAFTENSFDGYLIFNSSNLLYFSGFSGSASMLISAEGQNIIYVYGVNYEQAKAEAKGFRVELVKVEENLVTKIAKQAKDCKVKKLAVDVLGVESWLTLTKEFSSKTEIEVNNSFVQALRRVKDKQEIEFMRRAGDLTGEGMKAASEAVKSGVKEYEVAAEIEYAMRKRGSGGTAFETIVASGPSSAFPHGGCSDREIRRGDLIVVDIGATYMNYCSDMTRTFVVGKASEKQQKIYKIVKTAQEEALKNLKSGLVVSDVDGLARKIIVDEGYGDYFVHRLGHGVGLEVHEAPTFVHFNHDILAAGNVITIEPGIYLPIFGGVRIEDTILVKQNGSERLTIGPYNLSNG
jgi:Xaa-Pro aminopeptidase